MMHSRVQDAFSLRLVPMVVFQTSGPRPTGLILAEVKATSPSQKKKKKQQAGGWF